MKYVVAPTHQRTVAPDGRFIVVGDGEDESVGLLSIKADGSQRVAITATLDNMAIRAPVSGIGINATVSGIGINAPVSGIGIRATVQ